MITKTFAPQSNLAGYADTLEFTDEDTGAAWFTLADTDSHPSEVTLKLRDPDTGCIVLSGSLTGGELEVTGDGLIEFSFPASSMSALCPKTYELGCLYTADEDAEPQQIVLGRLPVVKGL